MDSCKANKLLPYTPYLLIQPKASPLETLFKKKQAKNNITIDEMMKRKETLKQEPNNQDNNDDKLKVNTVKKEQSNTINKND